MAIIDICTFNNESELFEIRYNVLKSFVDEFRVIEFDKTFSGKPKEKKFNQHWDKVKHYFVTEDMWGKDWEEARKSPNTNYGEGSEHWIREWCMKESIKDCLTNLKNEDTLYIGDVDEIWQSFPVDNNQIFKLKLKVYTYWLNNKSTEEFWGTIVGKYGIIKDKCLNHIRSTYHNKTTTDWGWHFTSLKDKLREKLTDSYTEETYASKVILNNLEENINNNRDFLGRGFSYATNESEWPQYLKDNRNKYQHLLK